MQTHLAFGKWTIKKGRSPEGSRPVLLMLSSMKQAPVRIALLPRSCFAVRSVLGPTRSRRFLGHYFRVADHSDRTTGLAGIRRHPSGARRDSGRCAVPATRTLTTCFLLEYSWSPSPMSFCDRCIHEHFSSRPRSADIAFTIPTRRW